MAKNTEAAAKAKKKKKPVKGNNICDKFDCIYHPDTIKQGSCNYIIMTGHRRGCPVEGCDKYQTGEKILHTKIASFERNIPPERIDADVAANADLLKDEAE